MKRQREKQGLAGLNRLHRDNYTKEDAISSAKMHEEAWHLYQQFIGKIPKDQPFVCPEINTRDKAMEAINTIKIDLGLMDSAGKRTTKRTINVGTYVKSKIAIDQLIKNKGEGGIRKAVADSGVDVKNPAEMVKTKTFRKAFEEAFPDEYLNVKHKELLEKRNFREIGTIKDKDGNTKKVYEDMGPDVAAVSKGLEMAYKIRGSFAADKGPVEKKTNTSIYNLFFKPAVRDQVKSFEEGLKAQIIYDSTKNTGIAKRQDDDDDDESDNDESGDLEQIEGYTAEPDGDDGGADDEGDGGEDRER